MKQLLEEEDKDAAAAAETLPTDNTGAKRRNTPRSRRMRGGQRQRLFLRRARLRVLQR
jgi:hypothetical protein